MMKTGHSSTLWNETARSLGVKNIFGIKVLQRVFYSQIPTVFKLFQNRVKASSEFATVTFFTVFKMHWHRVSVVLFII